MNSNQLLSLSLVICKFIKRCHYSLVQMQNHRVQGQVVRSYVRNHNLDITLDSIDQYKSIKL